MRSTRWSIAMGLALVLVACGGGAGLQAKGPENGLGSGAAVSDDAFASSVRDLLGAEPGSPARAQRLEGSVARQFIRSSERFRERGNERGIAAFSGAFSLVRVGEFTDRLYGVAGVDALRGASRDYARKGDEGRARAVYGALARTGSPDLQEDAKGHLAAIDAWVNAVNSQGSGGPIVHAGVAANIAISTYLAELSPKSRDEAVARTSEWVSRAIALRDAFRRGQKPPPREEANEAIRALSSGPLMLVAIFLRANDLTGALDLLDRLRAKPLVKPEILRAMERAQSSPSAAAFVELARGFTLDPRRPIETDEEMPMEDLDVFRAGALSCFMEAFRLEPTHEGAAFELALRLREGGMAEAAPAVLVPAAMAKATPRFVEASLSLTASAMQQESEADDRAAARRVFRAAKPLVEVAERVAPASVPRLYLIAGDVELREGSLKEARTYLDTALRAQPSALAEYDLARIDAHEGQADSALRRLAHAKSFPEVQKDPYFGVEIDLVRADVLRDKRDPSARAALLDAWAGLSRAPAPMSTEGRIREQLFTAKILERFGATAQATEALARAHDDAVRERKYVGDVTSAVVARALVRGDLAGARAGLQKGMSADVEPASLLYPALWVRLLEKRVAAPSEPLVDRILVASEGDRRWVGRIAAYARGQLSSEDLNKLAKTPSERTEAKFYAALERVTVSGATLTLDESALRAAIECGGIGLSEYAIARDLLDGKKGPQPLGTPPSPIVR